MKNVSRVLTGLCVIAVAAVIALSHMGMLTVEFSVAQVMLGVLAVITFCGAIADRSFGGFFVALGLLWIGFGEMVGLPHVSVWIVLLTVLLLTIGFEIIFPQKKHFKSSEIDREFHDNKYQEVKGEEGVGYIYASNRFGALAKYVTTTDLSKAELSNAFGQMLVYFDQATLSESGAEIYVNGSFGEMQLFIPKGWKVKNDVSVFAGQCVTTSGADDADGPVVHLIGKVSFGQIVINYV